MNDNERKEKFSKVVNLLQHIDPKKYTFQPSLDNGKSLYRQFSIPKPRGASDVKIHFEINHRRKSKKIQIGFHYEPPSHQLEKEKDEIVRLLRWRLLGFLKLRPELQYSTVWYNLKKIRASYKGIVHPYEGLSIHVEVDENIRWQDLFSTCSKFLEDYYDWFVCALHE